MMKLCRCCCALLLVLSLRAKHLDSWLAPTATNGRTARGGGLVSSASSDEAVDIMSRNATTTAQEAAAAASAAEPQQDPKLLLQQAQALREQVVAMRQALNESKIAKAQKEEAKVDHWIRDLFLQPLNDDTELLQTVEHAVERLQRDRYSQEQINKIFRRLCRERPQSRSHHSPLMALLVEAAGRLDDLERCDNPNKRWSGKVEQALQKKLFALDWNIELVDPEEDDKHNPWKW